MTCRGNVRRRGFAMIIVIAIIGLVGVSFLGLLSLVRADVSRTRSEQEQAQARQLLLAGARLAESRANQWMKEVESSDDVFSVPSVSEKSMILIATRPEAEKVIVEITASVEQQTMRQTLTYRRVVNAWLATSATMN